jgi:hypothetical protein
MKTRTQKKVAALYSYQALFKVRAPMLLMNVTTIDGKHKELFISLNSKQAALYLLEYLYSGYIDFTKPYTDST